jgi:hypothetical protein
MVASTPDLSPDDELPKRMHRALAGAFDALPLSDSELEHDLGEHALAALSTDRAARMLGQTRALIDGDTSAFTE